VPGEWTAGFEYSLRAWWLLLYKQCIDFVHANVFNVANVFCKNVLCSTNVLPLSACFLKNMCLCWHVRFYLRIKSHWCDWRKNSAHKSSHSGRHNVYIASRRSSLHTAAADPQLLESGKAEVQESAGQWQRAWSEHLTICREDLFWKEAFIVLQLGTPTKAGATKPGATKPGATEPGMTPLRMRPSKERPSQEWLWNLCT
jgi:hypothetical protein